VGMPQLVDRIRTSRSAAVPTTTISLPVAPQETLTVTDDSGRLTISVPTAWSDTNGEAWYRDGAEVGIQVGAAPDLEAWRTGWGTPGVFVGVSEVVTLADAYGDWGGSCTRGGDEPFVADGVSGTIHVWVDCGSERSTFLDGAGSTGSVLLLYQAVLLSDDDRVAASFALTTLSYLR
jgi:serine protease Do